eukprot:11187040-Lingulodinium_polyedra.AAC.1
MLREAFDHWEVLQTMQIRDRAVVVYSPELEGHAAPRFPMGRPRRRPGRLSCSPSLMARAWPG